MEGNSQYKTALTNFVAAAQNFARSIGAHRRRRSLLEVTDGLASHPIPNSYQRFDVLG